MPSLMRNLLENKPPLGMPSPTNQTPSYNKLTKGNVCKRTLGRHKISPSHETRSKLTLSKVAYLNFRAVELLCRNWVWIGYPQKVQCTTECKLKEAEPSRQILPISGNQSLHRWSAQPVPPTDSTKKHATY